MSELAFVVIASERRRTSTFPQVLTSVLAQEYGEVVVIADFPVEAKGVRSYVVPAITRTTIDALMKRDVGTVTTTAPNICYLCDDHQLAPDFADAFLNTYIERDWSVLVPSRFAMRDGEKTWLNVGRDKRYAGGHCAIYRRYWVTREVPWLTAPHNLNWDLYHSHEITKRGTTITYADQDLVVEDLDLEAVPWL